MVTHVLRKVFRVSDVMRHRGIGLAQLISCSGLDDRVVGAIVAQRYVPSPQQRRRVAAVLGTEHDELLWGHALDVEQLKGPC